MSDFLRNADPGDVLIFAPELLAGTHYYARLFPDSSGKLVEESDRYTEAILYRDLARECFQAALAIQPTPKNPDTARTHPHHP